ncbi:glycosyltransferase family 39 protein [Gordonia soli]|uniref:Glycosyltransferase RgtA/B/C/D-like domain-containing protein n=1 Tax=Gordonia soli NBRC 108243 TaxID=1223545 RepID=M0QD61_9ACTN|nr:glycosyltransferase family 39 protein [Gordonia soli]GAC66266.1 hypothetical protein GS4_01_00680 [Gordonia soli NBRC 108243]
MIFVACFGLYLGCGIWLAVDQQFFVGDSLSRVQSAQSVLFSRDPHVAAIGFIFTPLTALAQLPMTALTPMVPSMTADALSAVIMSAAFMAAAVYHVFGVTRDRETAWWYSVVIASLFAIQPMIVFYGANGMSEAPFLCFMCWAARRLIRWVDSDDVHDLVTAGIALGLAYFTRYDAVAATVGAAVLVCTVTFRRRGQTGAPTRRRIQRAAVDSSLVILPPLFAFVLWAVTSWLITGNALAQFTSEYGNSAIIEQSGTSADSALANARFSLTELIVLFPALPVGLVVVAALRMRIHRFAPFAVPLLLFGSVLAFQTYSYITGSTFGFLRFYIAVIPLGAVAAALALPAQATVPSRRPGRFADLPHRRALTRRGRHARTVASMVVILCTALSIPTSWQAMKSQTLAPQEAALHTVLADDSDATGARVAEDERAARSFSTERQIAHWLDSQQLPEGSVVVDTLYGFAIVARSSDPKQFVIPSDQDFTEILNDPAGHRVRYLLSVPPRGRGTTDSLNKRYPTLFETGSDIGRLHLEVPNAGADLPTWRVYEVLAGADPH